MRFEKLLIFLFFQQSLQQQYSGEEPETSGTSGEEYGTSGEGNGNGGEGTGNSGEGTGPSGEGTGPTEDVSDEVKGAIRDVANQALKAIKKQYEVCLKNPSKTPNQRRKKRRNRWKKWKPKPKPNQKPTPAPEPGEPGLLVWDKYTEANDMISTMAHTAKDQVIIAPDINEDPHSPQIQRLAQNLKRKKPRANITLVDWGYKKVRIFDRESGKALAVLRTTIFRSPSPSSSSPSS